MQQIMTALAGTPWWVYAIFCYLVIIGFMASKTQIISYNKLFILPSIMILWSAANAFIFLKTGTLIGLMLWISASIPSALGTAIGWYMKKSIPIKADHVKKLIQIPGSWTTLGLFLLLFAIKYYYGYSCATSAPDICQTYRIHDMLISTFIRSIFVGSAAYILYAYKKAPQTDLAQ